MAPRVVNPTQHAARRDEFIEAGQRLIQTRGYEQFSVEDLLAEVSASKGAFYHYFDSKQALLQAIVERMAQTGLASVSGVVTDPDLDAIEKLHRFFASIATFKAGQREFVLQLMRVWHSDDNAIVREKLRRTSVGLVAPHIATIIRQGVAEGSFTLADPTEMARVVLALILDMGDEAAQLYLARQADAVDVQTVRTRFATFQNALERVLGVTPGAFHLFDEDLIQTWFV